jgi:hypothetical protein
VAGTIAGDPWPVGLAGPRFLFLVLALVHVHVPMAVRMRVLPEKPSPPWTAGPIPTTRITCAKDVDLHAPAHDYEGRITAAAPASPKRTQTDQSWEPSPALGL